MTDSTKPAVNPTIRPEETKTTAERKRIPMSIPQRKLEVPELPGYHLHWFLEGRVPRALQGGYEFVDIQEIGGLNQHGVANDSTLSGNSSLGSRVTVVSGEGQSGSAPDTLVMMKIKEEWYLEDQKILEARNNQIIEAIRQRQFIPKDGESAADQDKRYVKQSAFETHTTRRRPVNG